MTKTVEQIIDELGGARAIAERTPAKIGAIRLWKHRHTIPRTAWPDLIRAFPDKLTLDDLLMAEGA